jgi:hypothetical protein
VTNSTLIIDHVFGSGRELLIAFDYLLARYIIMRMSLLMGDIISIDVYLVNGIKEIFFGYTLSTSSNSVHTSFSTD